MTNTKPTYRADYAEYPVCPKCRQSWQLIDWGCAMHRLTCGDVQIPLAEQNRIIASAAANGQQIRFL